VQEQHVLVLDLVGFSFVGENISFEAVLLINDRSIRRFDGTYMLLLLCVKMLDRHQTLPMFLIVALDFVDFHQARLSIFSHY